MSDIGSERPHERHGNGPRRERPRALVAGITGQDGSYLAELLLQKGYIVHGIVRPSSTESTQRIDHLRDDSTLASHLIIHNADLLAFELAEEKTTTFHSTDERRAVDWAKSRIQRQ